MFKVPVGVEVILEKGELLGKRINFVNPTQSLALEIMTGVLVCVYLGDEVYSHALCLLKGIPTQLVKAVCIKTLSINYLFP